MLHPNIGIRPTIDGRWGGIREGLDELIRSVAAEVLKGKSIVK